MVTLSFLQTAPSPSVTLSNPEDLEQRCVNLLVARKTTKGDKFLLRVRPHTSAVPAWNEAFQMLTHWVKSFTMQLLPAQKPSHRQSSPPSHLRQRTGSRAGKHQETVSRQLSVKSFFSTSQRQWERRDSGAHEPEMSSGLRHRSP